ncbi:glutathione S-transferase family protein [Pelagibius marinus]|uniref:glutathione S-transferase family protein n=1 Tax=Pelagibius marinus TaxID=2762760 RepID=UPI001872DDF0|nr:glutathione S-transferase family protein [Pelagibius marinus]
MKSVLFGPSYSVYVRIAKIVLAEKGVAYDQAEFDVFDRNDWPADWPQRHPFGKVPAFEHDGFRLYETRAITRYIDEAFDGPALQPASPQGRARVEQVISVLDGHGYRPMVWEIYVERVSRGKTGESDEAVIAAALPKAELCLAALADVLGEGDHFGGAGFGLADAHAAPIFDYFVKAPEGQTLLKAQPALAAWWARVGGRASVCRACERENAS